MKSQKETAAKKKSVTASKVQRRARRRMASRPARGSPRFQAGGAHERKLDDRACLLCLAAAARA